MVELGLLEDRITHMKGYWFTPEFPEAAAAELGVPPYTHGYSICAVDQYPHGRPSVATSTACTVLAQHSTWLVCGNMSTGWTSSQR